MMEAWRLTGERLLPKRLALSFERDTCVSAETPATRASIDGRLWRLGLRRGDVHVVK